MDLQLPFEQLNYNGKILSLNNKMVILSQAFNLDTVKQLHLNSGANIKDIRYVPFNEWILFTNDFIANKGIVDLIFGTSNRNGKREEKYKRYFFKQEKIKVELYGSIKKSDFSHVDRMKAPIFSGKLRDASKVIDKNAEGFATIIIGDDNYNNNMLTLRFSESLLANCITFIDEEFDSQHKIYPNEKFLYVKSGKELEEKILFLKNNPEEYKRLIDVQHKKVEEMRQHNFPKLLNDALMKN